MSAMKEGIPYSNEFDPAMLEVAEAEVLGLHEGEPERAALTSLLRALTAPAAERSSGFEFGRETAERVVTYGGREVTITYVVDADGNPVSLVAAKLGGEQSLEINAADFQ